MSVIGHPMPGVLPVGAILPFLLFPLALLASPFQAAAKVEHQLSVPATAEETHRDHDHAEERAEAPDHEEHAPDQEEHNHDEHVPGHEAHDSDHAERGHEDEGGSELHLSSDQRRTLALELSELQPSRIGKAVRAPGEVRLNAYATAQVTPRIEAQVIARHARLGEHVKAGQSLVTLSSVEMAEAQGDLVVAEREWRRLSRLEDRFVTERSLLEARVLRRTALSRVLAYGMTRAQADALAAATAEQGDGTFKLLAPRSGTVVGDDFVLGELVQPGRVLFEITDESVRWVEARMPPREAAQVSVGDRALIDFGQHRLEGRVSQIHHLLDESTRTQAVRIEVPDPAHLLHPGVFVEVTALAGIGEPVLAVPEEALLRGPDGHWQLFAAEREDRYRLLEVELLRNVGGMAVIDGIPAGTRVVTRGAFFLQSELAKSGFDPHNH